MGRLTNQIRIEQTRGGLETLQAEINIWLEKRRKKDTLQQYYTQLQVLENVLDDALTYFREMLDGVVDTQPSGEVYMVCRTYDLSLLQLRRIWSFFQSKFDQRDDPVLAPVLAAADEIAWSCYTEVFRNIAANYTDQEVVRHTTPLPYVEADYSPRAIPRDDPPGNLNNDPELRKLILRLPIPIVSLPPLCVQEPWWLIYLGHEIGHHVQHDLVPDAALVNSFGSLLQNVVLNNFVDDTQQAARWGSWKEEIFADLCSVYCMGPWSVRAMIELEMADEKTMLSSKPRYPSPVVRLELLAQTVEILGMSRQDALGDLQSKSLIQGSPLIERGFDLRQVAFSDFTIIPPCAKAVTQMPLLDGYRFNDLYNWNVTDFTPYGSVDNWKQGLLASGRLYPEKRLEAPRMIISGAVAAWTSICTMTDAMQRKESYLQLALRLLAVLKDSREEGVRGISRTTEPDIIGLGNQVANQILQTRTASMESIEM